MVNFITYKGEEYPVKVGYYAFKKLQDLKKGKGGSIADLEGDLSLYEPLLYYSLQKGAKLENVPMTFKLKDMEDVLEDVLFSQFMDIVAKSFDTEETPSEDAKEAKQKEVGREKETDK